MSEGPAAPVPTRAEVFVPEDMRTGVYANSFGAWFNQTDFTIDALVHLPTETRQTDDGSTYVHMPLQVVSRIKLPPPLMFRLIEQLNQAMTQYERQFGEITPLGPPIPPPADNQAGHG